MPTIRAAVAAAAAVIVAPLLNPAPAGAGVYWAAAVWSSDQKSADWYTNYRSQTTLVLAIQDAGWAGYQAFRSGQCAAIAYYSYRGLGGVSYNGVIVRVDDTEDGAASDVINSANAKVAMLPGGRTTLAGTYCQG